MYSFKYKNSYKPRKAPTANYEFPSCVQLFLFREEDPYLELKSILVEHEGKELTFQLSNGKCSKFEFVPYPDHVYNWMTHGERLKPIDVMTQRISKVKIFHCKWRDSFKGINMYDQNDLLIFGTYNHDQVKKYIDKLFCVDV